MKKFVVGFLTQLLCASISGQDLSGAATAWLKEPSGYRGLEFGSVYSRASADQLKLYCPTIKDARRICLGTLQLGSVDVHDRLTFFEDRFVRARMNFDPDSYGTVREVFLDKYGRPSATTNENLQNRMGAKFENEILIWRGKTVNVLLERYCATLDEGCATLTLKAYSEQQDMMDREEKKKATEVF